MVKVSSGSLCFLSNSGLSVIEIVEGLSGNSDIAMNTRSSSMVFIKFSAALAGESPCPGISSLPWVCHK